MIGDKEKSTKILENIKKNEPSNEEFKVVIENIIIEKNTDIKENTEKIFNYFISLWSISKK